LKLPDIGYRMEATTLSRREPKLSYWQDAPQPREQLVLFAETLEDRIPHDHPVRLVDEILDQLDWTQWEAAYDGSKGKPPIHPSVLAKTLLFALLRKIRSSRQIEYNLKHSIDFMWLTSGRSIDHSTLSEFRRKHPKNLGGIFRQMIQFAVDLKLANLSELCIDGTRVLGDANRYQTWTDKRLARALDQLDSQLVEALKNLETADSLDEDLLGEDISADRLPAAIADLKSRREQLAALQETAQEMDAVRKKNGSKGAAQIPKADPDSRILPNKEGGYAANYTPMATTETGLGMIVNAEVVIGNVEHDQLPEIVDAVQADFDLKVKRVLADTAFTCGENLVAAEARDVELIGPLAEPKCKDNPAHRDDPTQPVADELVDKLPVSAHTKRFSKTAFVFDEENDCYYCPAGKPLPHRITYSIGQPTERNVYTCGDCAGCALAPQCVRKSDAAGREVIDNTYEPARRRHRQRMESEAAQLAYKRRTHFGEVPFAVIKVMFDLRRFLLRGKEGVGQEWRWASTAFNLKKLMSKWEAVRALLEQKNEPAVG
jgi:transposase